MGIITRFRRRLRTRRSSLPKSDDRDERIADSVCLLSVLLLLPYCCRGHVPILLSFGGTWLITYSCLVLPLLISANYKYPARWLISLTIRAPGIMRKVSGPVKRALFQIYRPLERCEKIFMKMLNLSNMATQIIFFTMCDRVLLCSYEDQDCRQKRFTGLYSLMFYNVIAYCISYIKELIEKEDWSPYVNMTQHSNLKHVAMSATKIVLEWTKAVTFIITVTFMLLVFGLEQGLQHYQPTALYTFITATYYMCSERAFVQFFPKILILLRLNFLEALEVLYAPVLLRYYTVSLAFLLSLVLLCLGQFRFFFIAVYLTVYLKFKDMYQSLLSLRAEQAMLIRFRQASEEEIENWDDVCAVCLSTMSRARVTPCQHLFHAYCLRQCLYASHNCPICKREYTFVL